MPQPSNPPKGDITRYAKAWTEGSQEALNELIECSYKELHRRAKSIIYQKQAGDFQPTELVNEAFFRLAGLRPRAMENRESFFKLAGHLMRNTLIDKFREVQAQKRGGGIEKTVFQELSCPLANGKRITVEQMFDFNDSIDELRLADPLAAQIVELRYFVGLTQAEMVEILGIPLSRVRKKYNTGREFIQDRMGKTAKPNGKA